MFDIMSSVTAGRGLGLRGFEAGPSRLGAELNLVDNAPRQRKGAPTGEYSLPLHPTPGQRGPIDCRRP